MSTRQFSYYIFMLSFPYGTSKDAEASIHKFISQLLPVMIDDGTGGGSVTCERSVEGPERSLDSPSNKSARDLSVRLVTC